MSILSPHISRLNPSYMPSLKSLPVSSLPLLHQILLATRLFFFSISSFLSLSHTSHLIEKCFTPFHYHIQHTSCAPSPNLSISNCSSTVPPFSFVSTLFILFLHTPTHLALCTLPTSSCSTHSFGRPVTSSAHNLLTSFHAQSFSIHVTSALDIFYT